MLVPAVPEGGNVHCRFCGNSCEIPEDGKGYCGLVGNENGKMVRGKELIASYYYDPHPTNCVSEWACPASGPGYPEYSVCEGTEYGYYNFAVFCVGCSYDYLFCQNWHFWEEVRMKSKLKVSDGEFLAAIKENTTCICFFGGDPSPQLDRSRGSAGKPEARTESFAFAWRRTGTQNLKFLKILQSLACAPGKISNLT